MHEPTDRRTPNTPELLNAEITGAENQADGHARAGESYPFDVIGFNPALDDQGRVTLYATRSRFDVAVTNVKCNAIVLKKIAALYCEAEADLQLKEMGIGLTNGPGANGERPRGTVPPLTLGGGG
jgi:hypothetical protein